MAAKSCTVSLSTLFYLYLSESNVYLRTAGTIQIGPYISTSQAACSPWALVCLPVVERTFHIFNISEVDAYLDVTEEDGSPKHLEHQFRHPSSPV